MIDLIVAHKCHSFKGRSCRRRHTLVHRHPEYFTVPLKHPVEAARSQSAMLEFRMDNDLGIHFFLCSPGTWTRLGDRELHCSFQSGKRYLPRF